MRLTCLDQQSQSITVAE